MAETKTYKASPTSDDTHERDAFEQVRAAVAILAEVCKMVRTGREGRGGAPCTDAYERRLTNGWLVCVEVGTNGNTCIWVWEPDRDTCALGGIHACQPKPDESWPSAVRRTVEAIRLVTDACFSVAGIA
jgi:hypothetical protein